MRETDVAAPVVRWMSREGWEVFQEVERGNVADIVGRFRLRCGTDLVWVVETKTSLSLRLLDQAIAWTPWAHFVSVAVPARRRGRSTNRASLSVLRHFGLGLLLVDGQSVEERVPALLHRIKPVNWRPWSEVLCEEQKTVCRAGSAGGGHWTPFKGTCSRLRFFVRSHPGCTMAEAIDGVRHHYSTRSSAIRSMRSLIEDGVVPGVRLERVGRKLLLYPDE